MKNSYVDPYDGLILARALLKENPADEATAERVRALLLAVLKELPMWAAYGGSPPPWPIPE